MAKFVFKDPFIEVNGVDLSDRFSQVELAVNPELQDDTSFGGTSRTNRAGLNAWSASCQAFQDFAAGKLDATLWPLVGADPFSLQIRANKTDPVSATNPTYSGQAVLAAYNPVAGTVGQMATTPVNFAAAEGGDLTPITS